jgi:hypothetical protein
MSARVGTLSSWSFVVSRFGSILSHGSRAAVRLVLPTSRPGGQDGWGRLDGWGG